mmetsp:Transcript_66806/g.188783  ORF Transcript_66806/g.188783 Transcript_66806/m.188783 type:complete len:245 (+) Transcript_66806:274-1008(+)
MGAKDATGASSGAKKGTSRSKPAGMVIAFCVPAATGSRGSAKSCPPTASELGSDAPPGPDVRCSASVARSETSGCVDVTNPGRCASRSAWSSAAAPGACSGAPRVTLKADHMHKVWIAGSISRTLLAAINAFTALGKHTSASPSKSLWNSPTTQAQAPSIAGAISSEAVEGLMSSSSAAVAEEAAEGSRSSSESASCTAYGRTPATRTMMSVNCSATSPACSESRLLEMSARISKYHAKSSTSA